MGFMWGSVAGAMGTIFNANQMATQAYKMKVRELKEFCKLKQLEWGVRAKLEAHYEHLYPEQVIINERAIIDELPPTMRNDLIREMYGQVVGSVPLFFGLDSLVQIELCLGLVALPALKGNTIARQGTFGDIGCRWGVTAKAWTVLSITPHAPSFANGSLRLSAWN